MPSIIGNFFIVIAMIGKRLKTGRPQVRMTIAK
jgi:hypothetical protein